MTNRDTPLVSIIVPCYNYGVFLDFTLGSILKQHYQNWECIIVDDGSVDNTRPIGDKYTFLDNRFRYIYQTNAGLSAARNTGILNAQGAYFQFLDADDLINESKIKLQISFMEENTDVDLIYGDAVFFDTKDQQNVFNNMNLERNKNRHLKISGKADVLIHNLCINNFIEVSSPLVRKKLVDKVGLFETAYTTYEDWQYWIRAAVKGCYFSYNPINSTETYIRYGHSSMLSNKKIKVKNGIRIRKFMMPFLSANMKLYNTYRLLKLLSKNVYLNLKS
jgi:glycosyltransferase involved in cell wall biosynthesis